MIPPFRPNDQTGQQSVQPKNVITNGTNTKQQPDSPLHHLIPAEGLNEFQQIEFSLTGQTCIRSPDSNFEVVLTDANAFNRACYGFSDSEDEDKVMIGYRALGPQEKPKNS